MRALREPSSLQSPWEFASAVGSAHENGFVVGMEELGGALGVSLLLCRPGHRNNKGRDCPRAVAGGGAWGEGGLVPEP